MSKSRSVKRKPKNSNVIGGQWLPGLLIWGGVLLMLTGGVIAYPTVQSFLAPPDAERLEFIVTLAPLPTAVAVQSTATPEATPTATPEAIPTATLTAPPPVILPETELVVEETPAAAEPETQVQTAEDATPEPTATPPPTPTPDPASLVPNRIIIPAINLDAPVIQVGWETRQVNGQLVSSWIVPDMFAAGWHVTSALPGELGNTVLNGHHNLHGEVFRDLVDLEPGDEVIIYTGQTSRYYAVTERHILEEKQESAEVRQQNAQFIMPTEDERLTMVTCWPYTNNTHRLIIVAYPTEPMPTPTPVAE